MIDQEFMHKTKGLIESRQFSELKAILPPHPEDIATLIAQISQPSWRIFIFRMIPPKLAVEVFEYMPIEEQEELLKSLSNKEIKSILNEMSADDRTELFEEMPAELVKRCMTLLTPEERKIALELLNFPEESVGRLITPDFVQLYEDMTMQEVLHHIRKVGLKQETIYHCYVLDREKRLKGVVSLKKVVLAAPEVTVQQIMFKDVIKVSAYTDREEAAHIFKKYDVIALPVVDNNDKLLGIVTFDDFVDVLEDEATEDFEKIAAVLPVEKPYMDAGFLNIVWKRSFWLILLAVFESLSGFVLQKYGTTIYQWVAITYYLPVLVATGGNAGTQSATIIIRNLATGYMKVGDFFRIVFRESLLGLCIGGILALVGLLRVFIQQNSDWRLGVAVGLSMGITILLAAIVGASLPLISRKFKCDPAIMSGPLITTIIDVSGIFIYLEIARHLLMR